jgi:hypothetical protein
MRVGGANAMPTIIKPYDLFKPLSLAVERAMEDFVYMHWNRRPVCIQTPPAVAREISELVPDVPVEACLGTPSNKLWLIESR